LRGWLLDTNVLSELARPQPDPNVISWLAAIPEERAFVSVLTLAEIDQGIEALPPADERRARYQRFRDHIEAQFAGRIVSLDDDAVRLWGALSGRYRRSYGGKAPVIDAFLAASAQRRNLYLATRNVADVRRLGASVFNPWSDDPAAFPLQL
jgi:predicted nucleic acid-binding protein